MRRLPPSPGRQARDQSRRACLSRSTTCGNVRFICDESGHAGDCSFIVEQIIIGTLAAVGAASGEYGCCGRMWPSTEGPNPRRIPAGAPPPDVISAVSLRCALVAMS